MDDHAPCENDAAVRPGVPPEGVDAAIAARFELLELAGSGGMGRVYRARDRATGEVVALKVLPSEGGDAGRFQREAAVLASLDHPGVVKYKGHGVTPGGAHFLVM